MTITEALLVSFLIGLIIFCERLFPFALFSKRKPGKLIHIFERYIPPVVMIGLLIYKSFPMAATNFCHHLYNSYLYMEEKLSSKYFWRHYCLYDYDSAWFIRGLSGRY